MAGTFQVVNPRRRRRRKRAAASHRRRRGRYYAASPNPRRRRRRYGMRRRYRRNPRAAAIASVPFAPGLKWDTVLWGAGGAIGSELATGALLPMLPADWRAGANAPLMRLLVKGAIGLGVPGLARPMIGGRAANALLVGAGIALAVDVARTWLLPALGVPGLSDYEMYGYETMPELLPESTTAAGLGATTYDTLYAM